MTKFWLLFLFHFYQLIINTVSLSAAYSITNLPSLLMVYRCILENVFIYFFLSLIILYLMFNNESILTARPCFPFFEPNLHCKQVYGNIIFM